MNEGDAILQDIIANPDDDGLRLIYADWLEDNGHPARAELIRVQVKFAGLSELDRNCNGKSWGCFPTSRCRGCQLRERESKVLPFVSTYTPYVLPDPSIVLNDWEFRRGFIRTVRCDMQEWFDHGKEICAMHPVECVELTDRNTDTNGEGRHGYCNIDWFKQELPQIPWNDRPFHLEGGIWHLLNGQVSHASNYAWKFWDAEQDAIDALSRACLAHARQLTQSPTAKV